ncbi:hypothetical protein DICSQDRAFT_152986 [Dichomitus squalens LYAD-421 SS1]|uniref:uncharacterized protein n=1 Tax=Dichomitus squalens (strain LYAD-421) TaxID=732165 RepID=UPI0004414E3D|nr:uncharacterized protein DICSQDRAFT_152986 [Dichomitus squalens LYAD-421 SS1]EJF64776.1 hypothetical protein DICSQDRAFT_152986 [Dichomitus squalens LYAD-421 SS1]
MPTATATTVASPVIPLKASHHAPATSSSTATTLRSLYPRAARAFLQRDILLTHSLLASAFALIHPPASVGTQNDALASARRKWDILRITFETTLFSSPPSSQDPEHLPSALKANLTLSPESLITTLHARSLQLFTPSDHAQRPSSAFLPAQILVTLVLASLKLDSTEVGRGMIEDWLAKQGQETDGDDPKGYAKVLELYCLHVLPRLQDWEYAEDFLTYERDLPGDVRQQYVQSLRQLRAQAATASRVQVTLPSPSSSSASTPSRSPSPAQSDSSASSSSTHTATPTTNGRVSGLAPLTPSHTPTPKPGDTLHPYTPPHSASSSSIASTATSRTVTPHNADRSRERERAKAGKTRRPANGHGHTNGHANPAVNAKSRSRSHSTTPAGSSASVVRRTPFGPPIAESPARPPSTLALVRASLGSLLQGTSRSRMVLYAVLFVVVPLVSFVLRLRRRRAGAGAPASAGSGSGSTVDAVRRRLRGVDGQGNVVGRLWEEVARAVLDTVRMAGRGLV